MTRQMTLVGFMQAGNVTVYSGSWRYPSADLGFLTMDYYTRIGKVLEEGKFDCVFFDDRLAMPGVYGDSVAEAVRYGARPVKLDLTAVLGGIIGATSRIGVGATYSTTYYQPYHVARTFATLDHLSGGRVTVGAGFGWNTDELADHGVPAGQRRAVLAEYVAAMRALWTQPEAAYDGKFVSFGPCWAFPKPVQAHLPLIIGAGGGPQTLAWIAQHADGWLTTPGERDVGAKAAALRQAWAAASRTGTPDIRVLVSSKPSADDVAGWAGAGVTECLWGLPDGPAGTAEAYLDRLAARVASWR